jgi:hypothetical protein
LILGDLDQSGYPQEGSIWISSRGIKPLSDDVTGDLIENVIMSPGRMQLAEHLNVLSHKQVGKIPGLSGKSPSAYGDSFNQGALGECLEGYIHELQDV